VDLLRSSQDLQRVNALILTPGDPSFDDDLPNTRVVVRARPEMMPAEPFALLGYGRRSFKSSIAVNVEVRIPGFLWDNAANLWAAIVEALTHTRGQPAEKLAHEQGLREAGISWIDLEQPAAPVGPDEVASGRFEVVVYVNG
jgi:hypothetical protein